MGDWGLEDKFLRTNIPGRYKTHWDKDSDDEERPEQLHAGSDAEESDGDAEPNYFDNAEPGKERDDAKRRVRPNPYRYGEAPGSALLASGKQTVAQYNYFKRMQYAEKMGLKQQRADKLLGVARGEARSDGAPVPTAKQSRDDDGDSDGDSLDDDFNSLDDDFIGAYRASRLNEMQIAAARPKRFGELRKDITKYEPNLRVCSRLNSLLELLARRRADFAFVTMTLSEAQQDFDHDVLNRPMLVLYRRGAVVDTLCRVTDDIGDDAEDDLELLLDKAVAGDAPSQAPMSRRAAASEVVAMF